MTWKTDQIQAVVFPLPGTRQPSALELWHSLLPGLEPESYQGSGPSPIPGSQASGTHGKFQVSISSQVGRIDIIASPSIPNEPTELPPQIEDLNEALEFTGSLAVAALNHIKVARVATVAQLSVHLENTVEIASFLSDKSGVLFPSGSTDNLYQFNVRKNYDVATDIAMNRVITWAAGAKQLVNARFDVTSTSFGIATNIMIPLAALKIDANSASTQDISRYAADMFTEHARQIVEISENGMESFRAN